MVTHTITRPSVNVRDGLIAFAAGFIAVLVFHQIALLLLNLAGWVDHAPYSMEPTRPFHIPQILSLAFWGGVWGIILAAVSHYMGRGPSNWLGTILFGAIAPTLVALFLVAPLKRTPIASDDMLPFFLIGILVNAAWAGGTLLFIRFMHRRKAIH